MSLGRASFFVPGERSLFHASLLIGKRSLLNIIKVSRKWKFCDHPDDKGPVTPYRLRTCIRGPRNGWSNLLERVIEERENKKNKQLVLSVKATSWNSGGKVRWVKSDGKNPQELWPFLFNISHIRAIFKPISFESERILRQNIDIYFNKSNARRRPLLSRNMTRASLITRKREIRKRKSIWNK